jgi:hypothetical protein
VRPGIKQAVPQSSDLTFHRSMVLITMFVDKLLEKKIGDEFSCTGMWWVPRPPYHNNPAVKHYGTLTFTPEGKFRLCTVGALDLDQIGVAEVSQIISEEPPQTKTIWGTSTSGESITLFDIHNVHLPIDLSNTTDASAVVYEPSTVLVASSKRWFARVEEVVFDELQLRYTHLAAWVSTSGLSFPAPQNCRGVEKGSLLFCVKPRLTVQTLDIGDYIVSLNAGSRIHVSNILISDPKESHTLTYDNDTSISIAPKMGNITFEDVGRLIKVMRNFLSLVMGEQTFIQTIDGTINNSDKKGDFDTVREFLSIHIPQHIEKVKQPDMLFPYRHIEPLFENALKKMFVKDMQPVYDQFFAELHNPPVYAEDEFMAAIRAIEVFHRRAIGGDYVAEGEYRRCDGELTRLIDTLVQECDFESLTPKNQKAFKQSLYQKLSYGYQYSLQRRVRELIRAQANVFLELFVHKNVNSTAREEFINKIVKTRNYYTHFDPDDKEAAITDITELALEAKRLIVLLYMLLLNYVGIPKEDVDAAIRKHSADMYCKFGYLRPR